jgi:hypothetical protein
MENLFFFSTELRLLKSNEDSELQHKLNLKTLRVATVKARPLVGGKWAKILQRPCFL